MNNVSLSFELICLMSWLIKNEKKGINALVKLALEHGFAEKLELLNDQESHQLAEHLYTTVMDFLLYLEQSLLQELDKEETPPQHDLLPTVKKIDGDLDGTILWQSMQQTRQELHKLQLATATSQQGGPSHREAEQLFLKTMLKNWTPDNDDSVN